MFQSLSSVSYDIAFDKRKYIERPYVIKRVPGGECIASIVLVIYEFGPVELAGHSNSNHRP